VILENILRDYLGVILRVLLAGFCRSRASAPERILRVSRAPTSIKKVSTGDPWSDPVFRFAGAHPIKSKGQTTWMLRMNFLKDRGPRIRYGLPCSFCLITRDG
jgi:hypothetical protein